MTNTGSGQELVWLCTLEDMARLESQWRTLDQASTADFVWFQSFEWCFKWMQHHGSASCTPQVLVLLENGVLIAVLPLMRKTTRLGITSLRILGEPHTQYANLLTADGRLGAQQRKLLIDALQTAGGCDQLSLPLVPERSALADLFSARAKMPALENASTQLDLSDYADVKAYESEQGKKTSRNLRRAVNQLQQQGELTFDIVRPSDAGFRNIVNQCLSMKSEWLNATGRSGDALAAQGHGRFLGDLQGCPKSNEGALAFVLAVSGRPVAIELGYLQRGHYYAYMGAFDWSLRNLSPGKLQMHKSICWLIDNNITTLDLLANPSDYKQNYASRVTPLLGFVVNLTWRGAGYSWLWTSRVKPALKHALSRLPNKARIFIHAARKGTFAPGV